MEKRILIVDDLHTDVRTALRRLGFRVTYAPSLTEQVLREQLASYHGITLRSRFRLGEDVLNSATQLEFIARLGSGLEHIDTREAQRRGIEVLHTPEGNAPSVGEHCLGMLLALGHRLHSAHQSVVQGNKERHSFIGDELMGQCVGLIGYGHTARAFAERLASLSVRTIAYDKYHPNWAHPHAKSVSMETLFGEAQILSMHVPLTAETQGLVNAQFLKRFKQLNYFINTSRGQVVDTAALCAALDKGVIQAAALDVWEGEGNTANADTRQRLKRLQAHPNVLLTPHIAGLSQAAFQRMGEVLVSKIKKFYHIGDDESD